MDNISNENGECNSQCFHAFPILCKVLCVPALDTSVSEKHSSPFMQNSSLSFLLYP